MAGGGGTRFWPLSRQRKPKQLLNLSGNGIMINETIDRISEIIELNNIFIVTHHSQYDKMVDSVGDRIREDHILVEPMAKNTSACIGYAAEVIMRKYGDGIMCIFPSDHFVKNQNEFVMILKKAVRAVENMDKLITIGIRPTFPSTGYGYVHYINDEKQDCYIVEEFIEKPNLEMARLYLESPGYVWNSGIFIWKASTILKNYKRFLPRIFQCLEQIGDSIDSEEESEILQSTYARIPSISIDYGVLERSDEVAVVLGDFGWNDVGSWDSLGAIYDMDDAGNIIKGEQINIGTKNCICYSENRLIATIGIENMIVVEAEDAVLVCRKDQAQKVKDIVDQLRNRGLIRYC